MLTYHAPKRGPLDLGTLDTKWTTEALLDAAYISRSPASEGRPSRQLGQLAGIPFAAKDNIETASLPTTAGSAYLANHKTGRDAAVVKQLLDEGARLVGKTNLHELALGITSDNATFGAVRNPFDPTKSAGGSSGGSAVAVALGDVPFALGTDTGGSVRIPASYCGVYGFRPTTGRYSPDGLIRVSWTRDTVGILADSISWIRRVDGILSRRKPEAPRQVGALRLGVITQFLEGLDPEVEKRTKCVLDGLSNSGVELVEISLPGIREQAFSIGMNILHYETEHLLREFLGAEEPPISFQGFVETTRSPDVRAILEDILRHPVSEPIYSASHEHRRQLRDSYIDAFRCAGIDALVYPTVITPAPPLARASGTTDAGLLSTVVSNATPSTIFATPSISIPAGFTSNNLPFGLSIEALPGDDDLLLNIVQEIERLLPTGGL